MSDKSSNYEADRHSSTYNPRYNLYPHPLSGRHAGITPSYRDRSHRDFSLTVREVSNWTKKCQNRKTFAGWVQNAHKRDYDRFRSNLLAWGAEDIQFAWDELSIYRDYVEKRQAKGCCIEPAIDAVWKADGIITEEIRKGLLEAVATLENVPDEEKNWRPDSDGRVLDLVDPSLWPVIYGTTLDKKGRLIEVPQNAFDIPFCFRHMGVTEIHPSINDEKDLKRGYSDRFCWLPSEFKVSRDGKATKINSYINNLSSPEQQRIFYPIIENIFTALIPMFELALADLARGRCYMARAHGCNKMSRERDAKGPMANMAIPKTNYFRKSKEILGQFQNNEEITTQYADSAVEVCYNHHRCRRKKLACEKICHKRAIVFLQNGEPPLDPKDMWQPPVVSRAQRLAGRNLKVVVKFTTIHLAPGGFSYQPTNNWPLEPMLVIIS
ncbi:hypothetical protein TWF730_004549 [Orbilia blumenaviensis]|uniref:DUF4246 domain-containing protein n=1 Tax=Orbilia blumenaviensis TaxID=1796055 RepID=A0AAV9U0V2_9PEZI